jgi:hypothetical protein
LNILFKVYTIHACLDGYSKNGMPGLTEAILKNYSLTTALTAVGLEMVKDGVIDFVANNYVDCEDLVAGIITAPGYQSRGKGLDLKKLAEKLPEYASTELYQEGKGETRLKEFERAYDNKIVPVLQAYMNSRFDKGAGETDKDMATTVFQKCGGYIRSKIINIYRKTLYERNTFLKRTRLELERLKIEGYRSNPETPGVGDEVDLYMTFSIDPEKFCKHMEDQLRLLKAKNPSLFMTYSWNVAAHEPTAGGQDVKASKDNSNLFNKHAFRFMRPGKYRLEASISIKNEGKIFDRWGEIKFTTKKGFILHVTPRKSNFDFTWKIVGDAVKVDLINRRMGHNYSLYIDDGDQPIASKSFHEFMRPDLRKKTYFMVKLDDFVVQGKDRYRFKVVEKSSEHGGISEVAKEVRIKRWIKGITVTPKHPLVGQIVDFEAHLEPGYEKNVRFEWGIKYPERGFLVTDASRYSDFSGRTTLKGHFTPRKAGPTFLEFKLLKGDTVLEECQESFVVGAKPILLSIDVRADKAFLTKRGDMTYFYVVAKYSDGTEKKIDVRKVTLNASDKAENVIQVRPSGSKSHIGEGYALGIGNGRAKISVEYTEGGITKIGSCVITVKMPPTTVKIHVAPKETVYLLGQKINFKLTAKNHRLDSKIIWKIDGKKVAEDLSKLSHRFDKVGRYKVQVEIRSADKEGRDSDFVFIAVREQEARADFTWSPEPNLEGDKYEVGTKMTFTSTTRKLGKRPIYRWFVGTSLSFMKEVSNAKSFDYTFGREGTYHIRLRIESKLSNNISEKDARFDVRKPSDTPWDDWQGGDRNKIEALGGSQNLVVCGKEWKMGIGKWPKECDNRRRVGPVDSYKICTGSFYNLENTGYVIYVKNKALKYEAYGYNGYFAGGELAQSWKKVKPDSLSLKCKGRDAVIGWTQEDGTTCSVRLRRGTTTPKKTKAESWNVIVEMERKCKEPEPGPEPKKGKPSVTLCPCFGYGSQSEVTLPDGSTKTEFAEEWSFEANIVNHDPNCTYNYTWFMNGTKKAEKRNSSSKKELFEAKFTSPGSINLRVEVVEKCGTSTDLETFSASNTFKVGDKLPSQLLFSINHILDG